MVDATISRVRLRDLTRRGRSRNGADGRSGPDPPPALRYVGPAPMPV